MYTWDALAGINIDLLVLFADFILYGLLLVFFEYRVSGTKSSALMSGRSRTCWPLAPYT
jgi:hypothetical protein